MNDCYAPKNIDWEIYHAMFHKWIECKTPDQSAFDSLARSILDTLNKFVRYERGY
jgi:hypothetical protein